MGGVGDLRVFHFPKHIFLLFFTLVFTTFFSLGIAGYIWAMKTENVYYLEDKANIGDYVISPSDDFSYSMKYSVMRAIRFMSLISYVHFLTASAALRYLT